VRRQSQLPRCPISIAGASVEPVNAVCDLGVFIDSDLGAATRVRITVSRCFAALWQLRQLRRLDTSPTTVSVLSWCRWCISGSTTATSYLSEFLPIFSDASRPYLTLLFFFYSVPTSSLRPRDRRPRHSPLAASTGTG